jgi:hypothetical protein
VEFVNVDIIILSGRWEISSNDEETRNCENKSTMKNPRKLRNAGHDDELRKWKRKGVSG